MCAAFISCQPPSRDGPPSSFRLKMESCSFKQTSQSGRGGSGKRRRDTFRGLQGWGGLGWAGGGIQLMCARIHSGLWWQQGRWTTSWEGPDEPRRGFHLRMKAPRRTHDFFLAFQQQFHRRVSLSGRIGKATLLARFTRVYLSGGIPTRLFCSRGTNDVSDESL